MALTVSLPDEIGEQLVEEARKSGMDVKTYIKMLLTNYATSKTLGTSTGKVSIDLAPVLNELNNIKQVLARIEERLNNLEQRAPYQQKREYKPYQKKYEKKETTEEAVETGDLESAINYAKQVLINNNNVITDDQLSKIADKFKVDKLDIVRSLYLWEKEPGKWVPQE